MHILLTDLLTCPRCGPSFGLILLADRMEDRRLLEGSLGCANCREEYRVRSGVADLRHPPGDDRALPPRGAAAEDAALRFAALLGVGERPGAVLLLGMDPALAGTVAGLLPRAQVAATAPAAAAGAAGADPAEGVSWLLHGEALPFRDRSLRGVAAAGSPDEGLLAEAVRAVAPGGHLVLDPAPAGAADALRARGLTVVLEQDGVVVASPRPAG